MNNESWLYAFRGADMLVRDSDTIRADFFNARDAALPPAVDAFDMRGCNTRTALYDAETQAPAGWQWKPLRSLLCAVDDAAWYGAARALSLAGWHIRTRYCGSCGAPAFDKQDETARLCPRCGALYFPRISPAVLAVIRKGDKLLLARNAANTSGFWSIIAGFVEPGEDFETCVAREALEEVNICIRVTDYLGSQPWPFPDQLMVGFAAEWVSGDVRPDGVEIAEAAWFDAADHPPIPKSGSLSRRLIDNFFRTAGKASPARKG